MEENSSFGLIIAMLVFIVLAAPLVFFLWRVIDEVLAGHIQLGADFAALIVACVFFGLAALLGRALVRTMGQDA
jgi:hypothetical protein